MIIDIPRSQDFIDAGLDYLNVAWSNVISIALEFMEMEDYDMEHTPDDKTQYWASSHRIISTSLSILQQGIESILKGRIAEISPFLLIANSPNEWPKPDSLSEIRFNDFRTLDAQYLIRIHNSVCATTLSDGFFNLYENTRKLRNKIMHSTFTLDGNSYLDILKIILQVNSILFTGSIWATQRRIYLERTTDHILYHYVEFNHTLYQVTRELEFLIDALPPGLLKLYARIDKKKRKYHCPVCMIELRESEYFPQYAQLKDRNLLLCPLCEIETVVTRKKCIEAECKGDVIDAARGICCTCLAEGTSLKG